MRIEFWLTLESGRLIASGLAYFSVIPQKKELISQHIDVPIPDSETIRFKILKVTEYYESVDSLPEFNCVVELLDRPDYEASLLITLIPVTSYSLSLATMTFPPLAIEAARKFAVCSPYKDWEICIYAGGGSDKQHDMFWAWVIYRDGGRQDFGRFPNGSVLDIDDCLKSCRNLIDFWEKPIDYEEIFSWREICEFISKQRGKTAYFVPIELGGFKVGDIRLLTFQGKPRRQLLWDLYFIQLVKWSEFKTLSGWCLKGGWEYKIDFLEKVYILGQDPESLPKPWLKKWSNLLDVDLNKTQ